MLPDHLAVGPGGTAVVTAEAIRRDGFQGPINLRLHDLPKGFVIRGAAIPAKQKEVRFTITAPDRPRKELLSPSMTGVARIGDHGVMGIGAELLKRVTHGLSLLIFPKR